MTKTALKKLERQYEQARNRLQAAKARETARDRKLDTRRKIILGAALIDRAAKDPTTASMVASLVATLKRKQDLKAFAGWVLPTEALDNQKRETS